LIKQLDNGKWFSSCPICAWKLESPTQLEAENGLYNHISINHREGRKTIPEEKQIIPPSKLPPQIPKAVKER